MTLDLPVPARSRWQPLRAGLIDLFYYDAEEFRFHDGRLLLRGNNGTGKSKVLALMLPFLLDGDLSPHRVEPDADSKKRMEWNLLLGGAHPNNDRLGYTWLEFGRSGDDGVAEYLTLGCGMKAVAGRGITRHWFFVTPQRPGVDLALIDATGTALTRERLIAALDGAGTVHDTARSYRRAVDEALFGLGDVRYGALVDLLVQLRQPQLSKKPSETALSGALTEALPPMDQAVLADVAEAFRALEEDREALRDMVEAERSASTFLGHYRRYAQVATRRRAERPRLAQSGYEQAGAALRAAQEAESTAAIAIAAAEESITGLKNTSVRLRSQQGALQDAPEMRDAGELERLGQLVRQRREELSQRTLAAETATARHVRARRTLDSARTALTAAQDTLTAQLIVLNRHAGAARAGTDHARNIHDPIVREAQTAEATPTADAATPKDWAEGDVPAADLRVLRSDADRIVARVTAGVEQVEKAQRSLADAQRAVAQIRSEFEGLENDANRLADQRAEAEASLAAAADALARATAAYLAGLTELPIGDTLQLEAEQLAWADTLDGPNPVLEAVERADLSAVQALTELRVVARAQRDVLSQAQSALEDERTQLLSGQDGTPPARHTRDPGARVDRPGAPLWQLIDFVDDVPAEDRAGLEAALEAAGILDAWVTPDGDVLADGSDDVVIVTGGARQPGPALASVMMAAVDRPPGAPAAAVPDSVVDDVLTAIALGRPAGRDLAPDTWIDVDGSFGLGVLTGQWRKDEAAFIGAGARISARRRRLSEIEEHLAGLAGERTRIDDELTALGQRDERRARERAAIPDDVPLRDRHRDVADLRRDLRRLNERLDDTRSALGAATATASSAASELTTVAADVGLPPDQAGLSEVTQALADYRLDLRTLWPALEAFRAARLQLKERAVDEEDAGGAASTAHAVALLAREQWTADAERERTLRSAVGQAVDALLRQLQRVADELQENDQQLDDARTAKSDAEKAGAKAEALREERSRLLDLATRERADATAAFQNFARTGLIAVALPAVELPEASEAWAPHPTVRLARAIEQELVDSPMDDPAWASAQRRVNEEFKTLTDVLAAQGSTASAHLLEDGFVAEVAFRGKAVSIPELVGTLSAEVSERGRILDEREREVLENHLVNEVASTLQDLMTQAERQVAQMNAELEDRPTSTGMRLRLRWIPQADGPAGLEQARQRLLRQNADAWSEQDRSAVGAFLQGRIADVRSASPSGTWLEHLRIALDYRAWNRFVIERFQNEKWRSATGPASGGERVLAASVPLFAAASSHYASAGNPNAPRLVMLDEAFAGVDDNARAKYLGLLAAFDLDVVMTSEREWGCYPEVPGLAIAQLSRVDGINAVLVTNWRWDGTVRERRPRPEAIAAPVPIDLRPPAVQSGLFDQE